MKLILQKLEGWCYLMVKIALSYLQPVCVIHPSDLQTGGQTDGRTGDTYSALSLYAIGMLSRAKNK